VLCGAGAEACRGPVVSRGCLPAPRRPRPRTRLVARCDTCHTPLTRRSHAVHTPLVRAAPSLCWTPPCRCRATPAR
jgi:hypothetical protein